MSDCVKTFVLNGWAASSDAWNGCRFHRDGLFSYLDHLDGVTSAAFDSADRAILVGWSMGGSYALRLALRSPSKVAGIVLLAATPCLMKDNGWTGMSERRIAALALGLKFTLASDSPEAAAYAADSEENLSRGLDYLRTTDLRAELVARRAELAGIPVFIFQSERDAVVKPHNAEFLAQIFPLASVEIIPGDDHALPLRIPSRIDEAVGRLAEMQSAR